MSNVPQAAALGGIALVILMAGVLAGYMIARHFEERRQYDTEIAGYDDKRAELDRDRRPVSWPPLPPELEAPELEAPKSTAPAPAWVYRSDRLQGAWPRPARLILIPGGSQRSRYPLEDTGRILLGTDAEELRELEIIATANRQAMIEDNAAWLEAWSKPAPELAP